MKTIAYAASEPTMLGRPSPTAATTSETGNVAVNTSQNMPSRISSLRCCEFQ